jgi:hypothetical protein
MNVCLGALYYSRGTLASALPPPPPSTSNPTVIDFSKCQQQVKKDAVLWAAEDLIWEALPGGPPGVMSVTLWGDQTKGAYTYNRKKHRPGFYVSVPGGSKRESGGVADSESIFFIEQPGAFDSKIIGPPMEKKQFKRQI